MCDGALDQRRASACHLLSTNELTISADNPGTVVGGIVVPPRTTAGTEPLVIDLQPLGGWKRGVHWIAEYISLLAVCTTQGPQNAGNPACGLFIVPVGTPPETKADASSALGINLAVRKLILPIGTPAVPSIALVGGGVVLSMVLQPGFKPTIPNGFMIRSILNCKPGDPNPGPGAGSFAILAGTLTEEVNCGY